jgi:hypothetical protein
VIWINEQSAIIYGVMFAFMAVQVKLINIKYTLTVKYQSLKFKVKVIEISIIIIAIEEVM